MWKDGFQKERDVGGKRDGGKEEQKERKKKKEQKYVVRISSIPYAINRGKVENHVHEIVL